MTDLQNLLETDTSDLGKAIRSVLNDDSDNFLKIARTLGLDLKVDLAGADLSKVVIPLGTDLSTANLRDTDFSDALLMEANLTDANLSGANLSNANLTDAKLSGANLSGANLSNASLIDADLSNANLTDANLSGANLIDADLTDANLSGASLSNANLRLVRALDTSFEGATLTGTCIKDWQINIKTNLDRIVCDYVYLEPRQRERRPLTGNFTPGEFTKLFRESLDTIDLIFREGLAWKAFAYSFEQVEVHHENAHLEVLSIENKGDGAVIVKVATAPGVDKGQIYTDFTQLYEANTKALTAQYEARLVDKDQHINQLFTLLQLSQERLGEVSKGIADTYYGDIKAANFTPHGNAMGGVYNDFSNTQDLAQAAAQIQALLAQLQQQGQSPEEAQQQVANDLAEQAKKDPTTLGKLVMWGQKLGDATVTDVVKGVVKMALRSAGVPLP